MIVTTPIQAVTNALKYIELMAATPEGLIELNRPSLGICASMVDVLNLQLGADTPESEDGYSFWNNTHKILFQEWPEFSGHEAYPVKVAPFEHPQHPDCMMEAANDQFDAAVIMYGHNAYGEARLRLVTYLRERYEQAALELEVAQGAIWLKESAQ